MVTFTVALVLLVLGYLVYGGFVNRVFAPDAKRTTPAVEHNDGVDYIPMPTWKIFMIQFLNIAGLGPIFGAIMGAQFGTASYLWIVIGTILAGAVHDFFSGCLSIRNNGANLPELIGKYLGTSAKTVMNVLSLVLMVLVGAVFVSGPAELLAGMTPAALNANFWIVAIFLYYILATLLPIDKIIGRIYPLFAISLLFMAFGILIMLYVKSPELPEMWNGFGTKYEKTPIFPMMFVSIACGAISGFHATQSPLMARCMKNERHCRPIFYGAMITEGIVALIWAAAATWFFGEHGTVDAATGIPYSGAKVATLISKEWLGTIGGVVAILGIVAAPITSGDTALRSARLILADFLHMEQRSIRKRLLICIPLFIVTMATLIYSLADADGFKIIWRYFAWCNQTLSVFTLWAITIYLVQERKPYIITLIPALFMTCVSATYICLAP
ncbi:MAG: carbon starvation protein A, partial [Bacteroidaceae bacterium]|nr:carbon starvation protein A [Bacteroidaceae bacterium]